MLHPNASELPTPDSLHPIISSLDNRDLYQSDINPPSADNLTISEDIYFDNTSSCFAPTYPEMNEKQLYIDVPDLQEDYYYSSPPSASSDKMIITPPMLSQDGFLGHTLPSVSPASWINVSNSPGDVWAFDSMISSGSSRSGEKESAPWDIFYGKQHGSLRSGNFDGQDLYSINKPNIPGFLNQGTLAFSSPQTGCRTSSNSLNTLHSALPSATLGSQNTHIPPPVPVQQHPIKLHQPRPSRYIPIISLTDLASACDSGEPVGSPLDSPFDHFSSPSLDDCHQAGISRSAERSEFRLNWDANPYKDSSTSNTSGHWSGLSMQQQVIKCSCGCMGAYI